MAKLKRNEVVRKIAQALNLVSSVTMTEAKKELDRGKEEEFEREISDAKHWLTNALRSAHYYYTKNPSLEGERKLISKKVSSPKGAGKKLRKAWDILNTYFFAASSVPKPQKKPGMTKIGAGSPGWIRKSVYGDVNRGAYGVEYAAMLVDSGIF